MLAKVIALVNEGFVKGGVRLVLFTEKFYNLTWLLVVK